MSSWWSLSIAILFGALGTICMKLSHGLKKWKPTISLLIFYSISFVALTLAIKGIDMSIVYAVWSGVGTILVAILGVFIFNEPLSVKKTISLILIVLGVTGIYLSNGFH